jgi:prepilin peptidase CpaA
MDESQALRELLWMLVSHPKTGALIVLLVLAAVIDWKTLRIPNWLTVGGMVYGILYNASHATSVGAGLWTSLLGLATGLALLMPLYLLRVLGAGDVKLMGTMGAFLGAQAMPLVTVFVLATGGLAAVLFALSRRALIPFLHNLRFVTWSLLTPGSGAWRPSAAAAMPSIGKLPYGVSICVGGIAFMVARQLGFA